MIGADRGRDAGKDVNQTPRGGGEDGLDHQRGHWSHEDDIIELLGQLVLARVVGPEGDLMFLGERPGQFLQHRQPVITEVAREHGHPGHTLTEVANDVHGPHGTRGPDDIDLVVRSEIARGGNIGHGLAGSAPVVPTTRIPP